MLSVAIVGRPNVGKSSLFNRIVGSRQSIVDSMPGTTRDRIISQVTWNEKNFSLIDTGGMLFDEEDNIEVQVKQQVEIAVQEADALVFVVDSQVGITPLDFEVATWIRKTNKSVILTVNKVDHPTHETWAHEFLKLGIGEPNFISAYHDIGVKDLLDEIVNLLPKSQEEVKNKVMTLSIVGKVNVGKSQLFNSIVRNDRVIVNELPGTTRDAVDTYFNWNGLESVIVDTAGMRRRGKIDFGVEKYSVIRAVKSLWRSDLILLVTSCEDYLSNQDAHIAGLAWESYKSLIIVSNKWDLKPTDNFTEKDKYLRNIRRRYPFLMKVPIVFISALLKKGLNELNGVVKEVYEERNKVFDKNILYNTLLNDMTINMSSKVRDKEFAIKNVEQTGTNPIQITLGIAGTLDIHFSYKRYIENHLRSAFELRHNRIKIIFKKVARK